MKGKVTGQMGQELESKEPLKRDGKHVWALEMVVNQAGSQTSQGQAEEGQAPAGDSQTTILASSLGASPAGKTEQ